MARPYFNDGTDILLADAGSIILHQDQNAHLVFLMKIFFRLLIEVFVRDIDRGLVGSPPPFLNLKINMYRIAF